MRKDEIENVIKIVKCLKQAESGWLWYREIGRRCKIHHKTVSRLINKYLVMFLDSQNMEPFNIKMVRIKSGTDLNGMLKFLAIKEKIENRE